MDSPHRTYHYNAHGSALSGHIQRPFDEIIEVQAGMSLPTSGGYGATRVNGFRFKEVVSFQSASTQVSGSKKKEDNSHTTLVSTTVEGLNILDVVTADRVIARLASHHPPGQDEASITLLGSHFENLRIAGCPVTVELDHDLFLRMDTLAAIRKEFESNSDFRRMAEDPIHTGQTQKAPDPCGVLYCSLVKDIKTTCPGVKRRGHLLEVPQFGKIFLAEVVAEHGTRSLTMLRLELGSPPAARSRSATSRATASRFRQGRQSRSPRRHWGRRSLSSTFFCHRRRASGVRVPFCRNAGSHLPQSNATNAAW